MIYLTIKHRFLHISITSHDRALSSQHILLLKVRGGEEVPSVCQNTLITSAGDNSIIWRRAQLEPFVRLTVPPNDVIWRQPPCKVGPPPNRLFSMHGTIITDGLISGRFCMKGMKSKKKINKRKKYITKKENHRA